MLKESSTTRATNKWVPEQINPETSLEAKRAKLKLSYLGHIMRRQGFLEKMVMLGEKKEGTEKEDQYEIE